MDEKMGAWSVLHWGARSEFHSEEQRDFQTEMHLGKRKAYWRENCLALQTVLLTETASARMWDCSMESRMD
jgi:hypothetical protein